jgi:hypothetical protein
VQTRCLGVAAAGVDPLVCENGRGFGYEYPIWAGLHSPETCSSVDTANVVPTPTGPLDDDDGELPGVPGEEFDEYDLLGDYDQIVASSTGLAKPESMCAAAILFVWSIAYREHG